MNRFYVTHLRLPNTRSCILYIRMNHREVHLMVTSRVIDSNGFKMAIELVYLSDERQNGECKVSLWYESG